jgi:ribosomal protein S18 acetylase RimI-like enzyme
MTGLYDLTNKDMRQAGLNLADAFYEDPIWKAMLVGFNREEKGLFFEISTRYCRKYGSVLSPSSTLEAVMGYVPGHLSTMTNLRITLSGAVWPAIKLGKKMQVIGQTINESLKPMEIHREDIMKGRPYTYLMMIGTQPAMQRQGHAKKLLLHLIKENDQQGIPVYLETETETNVDIYKRFDFKVIRQITLPGIDLPMWLMVREPAQ